MPTGELLAGTALLALAVGSSLVFAAVVVRRRLPQLAGTPRLLALALIAILGFYAVHLVPGALGVLGRPAVAGVSIALLIAAWLVREAPERSAAPAFPQASSSGQLGWALAGLGIAIVIVYTAAHLLDYGGEAPASVDMTTFHLPNVAGWIQSGSFWRVDDFVPHRSFGTYPNTSDVLTMAAVLPFDSDFLIRFVHIPFLALTGIATYALGRELTAPAATAAIFAAMVTAMPVVSYPAFEGLADSLMLATFGLGLLFLIRHRRTGAQSDLVLAGLGLGLSFGTKWYAVPAVVAVVVVWAASSLVAREPIRKVLAMTGLVTALIAVAGSFWLLRNWVEVGNPVFPVKIAPGGLTVFDAPHDVQRELIGFNLAHYFDQPDIWRHVFWPGFLAFMGWAAVALWAALPLGAVVAWLRRSEERGTKHFGAVILCLAAATAIGLVYLKIPYTAQGEDGDPLLAAANSRYVVPALLIAAAVGAWAVGRLGRAQVFFQGLALLAIVDAVAKSSDKSGDVSLAPIVAALGLVAAAAVAWLIRRRLATTARRVAVAVGSVVLLGAGVYAQESRYSDDRYLHGEVTARWVSVNAPEDKRVGVVGEGFIVYPMFGPRLENDVEYVGPTVDGFLEAYRRKPDFERALRRGGYDLVLVQHQDQLVPGIPDRHERWLRELGYQRVASGLSGGETGNFVKTLYRSPSASSREAARRSAVSMASL